MKKENVYQSPAKAALLIRSDIFIGSENIYSWWSAFKPQGEKERRMEIILLPLPAEKPA